MEKAIIDNTLFEVPEKRSHKPTTVRDALRDILYTKSRGAYLQHYDCNSLSAILTAIEASKKKDEARAYYTALNLPVKFQLITIEKRSQMELDMIQKLIDIPSMDIYESINQLSV